MPGCGKYAPNTLMEETVYRSSVWCSAYLVIWGNHSPPIQYATKLDIFYILVIAMVEVSSWEYFLVTSVQEYQNQIIQKKNLPKTN